MGRTQAQETARGVPTNFGKIANMEKCPAVHCEGEKDNPVLQNNNKNKVTCDSLDCWSASGNFIDRHHVQQRCALQKAHSQSRFNLLMSYERTRQWKYCKKVRSMTVRPVGRSQPVHHCDENNSTKGTHVVWEGGVIH